MDYAAYTTADFDHSPLMFYYETTTACDLVCKHCRASAQENPDPEQLSTEQSKQLLSQIAQFPKRPMVVLTGGDPLKRHDLMELIAHGRSVGLEMALTPSATPLATNEAFARVREAGIKRLGISLDGPNAQVHDYFRGWEGSFQRTREMLLAARELGMAVQVNTSVCRRNVDLLDEMAEFLTPFGIAMWALFFLVPVGRGVEEERIKPEEYELVFEKLYPLVEDQALCREDDRGPALPAVRHAAGRQSRWPGRIGRRQFRASRPPRPVGRERRQGDHVRQQHRRDPAGRLPAHLLRQVSRRTTWSKSIRSTPSFSASARPAVSRASAASASTTRSAAAAVRGPSA